MKRIIATLTALTALLIPLSAHALTPPCGTLPTPNAPTFANGGVSGITAYGYKIEAASKTGASYMSAETVGIGANLSATNFNRVTWDAVPGATKYHVYRTTNGQDSTKTGLIATVTTNTFNDTDPLAHGTHNPRCQE